MRMTDPNLAATHNNAPINQTFVQQLVTYTSAGGGACLYKVNIVTSKERLTSDNQRKRRSFAKFLDFFHFFTIK